jgi:hypothetical protein
MANLPISGLPAAASLDGTELLPFVQGGVTTQANVQDILNANLPITSSGIVVSGPIVPSIPSGSSLGTAESPFGDLYVSSGSINIASDVPGDPNTSLSNESGNILVSAGGMRLIEPGNSFIAETGSFSYLSGSLEYVGEMNIDGNITFNGESALLTASISNSILTFTKTNNSTFDIELPIYNDSSGSNIDNLGGVSVRTLYTRNSDIVYTSGSGINTDFLGGSTTWGSRALPQSFFDDSINYVAKILHFRAVGKFGSTAGNDTNAAIRLQIGDQILDGTDLGTQTLAFSVNKPFEILGELVITAGSASACYSIGWCDQTGDMRSTPLSDVTISGSFANLTPGDFKIIVSGSTNRTMTSYYAYVQAYN